MTENTQRRGRQLPTTEQLRIWRDFIETAEVLKAEISTRLQSETSLSPGDYVVLLALTEAEGGRMRSSELAAVIGWERSRLSHHLGRMERRALISRQECVSDNRGAEIVLAPAGAEAFQGATVPHLRAIREIFVDALTPDQLTAAGELAASLRAHLGSSRPR
ncbi:MarR family winged helix-turn-helix transcriptional regulator [Micromonospora psammae]|uniref:MarR family winged helix-turn-helix transcriptional regulator n=1 Tax=Micromonospora sp. CPCC 205556 TaxID=3122398 RepID=UPI002FF0FD07